MSDFRKRWNASCMAAGIPSITESRCAMILAVIYLTGDDERLVMCRKLQDDIVYIRQRFHIDGGQMPDEPFTGLFKQEVSRIDSFKRTHDGFSPDVDLFFKSYYQIDMK